jgi:hypothetical protein
MNATDVSCYINDSYKAGKARNLPLCGSCYTEKFGVPPMTSCRYGLSLKLCHICNRDASYPLGRDYKLWELDSSVKVITGMEYEELRERATDFFGGESPKGGSQNSPLWDAVLKTDARAVWEWRRRIERKERG